MPETTAKYHHPLHAPENSAAPNGTDSLYERALTARFEGLVGPPGTHPFPIVVGLVVDDRRLCTRITRQRNWIAQLAKSNRLPM